MKVIQLTPQEAELLNQKYPTMCPRLDANGIWVIPEENLSNPLFEEDWEWLSTKPIIAWNQPSLQSIVNKK